MSDKYLSISKNIHTGLLFVRLSRWKDRIIFRIERALENYFSYETHDNSELEEKLTVRNNNSLEWNLNQELSLTDVILNYLNDYHERALMIRFLRKIYFWLFMWFELDELIVIKPDPPFSSKSSIRGSQNASYRNQPGRIGLTIRFIPAYLKLIFHAMLRAIKGFDYNLISIPVKVPKCTVISRNHDYGYKIRGPS